MKYKLFSSLFFVLICTFHATAQSKRYITLAREVDNVVELIRSNKIYCYNSQKSANHDINLLTSNQISGTEGPLVLSKSREQLIPNIFFYQEGTYFNQIGVIWMPDEKRWLVSDMGTYMEFYYDKGTRIHFPKDGTGSYIKPL
jgi:hypothetical protein